METKAGSNNACPADSSWTHHPLQPQRAAERPGVESTAVEQRCAMVVAERRAVAGLAAGDEALSAVEGAAEIHADVIDLRPVAGIGVEEDEVARLKRREVGHRLLPRDHDDARRAVEDLMGAARHGAAIAPRHDREGNAVVIAGAGKMMAPPPDHAHVARTVEATELPAFRRIGRLAGRGRRDAEIVVEVRTLLAVRGAARPVAGIAGDLQPALVMERRG